MKNISKSPRYYDFTEGLNFFWTCLILLALPLMVFILRVFFLKSIISCWTPAKFTGQWNDYSQQRCWEKTNYFPLDFNSQLDVIPRHRGSTEAFHAWIPIVVIFMIIGFKIPQAVKYILDTSFGEPSITGSGSCGSGQETCQVLVQCVKESVQRSGVIRFFTMFFVKFLVGVNLVVQLVFVKLYFKDYDQVVTNKTEVTTVKMFPKVLLCDFEIRQLQHVNKFIVQCDMPINHFYEEYFRLLGFWIICVIIATGLMFVFQFATLVIPPLVKLRFRAIIPEKELNLRGFAVDDALLLLEDIRDHFGVVMAREVASKLWETPHVFDIGPLPSAPPGYGYRDIPMTAMGTTNPTAPDTSPSHLLNESISAKP